MIHFILSFIETALTAFAMEQCQNDMTCSRCNASFYCSRAHQIADVKRHKAKCVNAAPMVPNSDVQRPFAASEESRGVKVVLFPANGLPPRIISMECHVRTSTVWHGLKEEWIDLRGILEARGALCGAVGSVKRASTRSSRLYLAVGEGDRTPDTPQNFCIRRYTEGHNDTVWLGNVVGVRCREPTTKYMQYLDVTDQDLAAFISYFEAFGTSRVPAVPEILIRQGSD
ncbi:hypothetical protein C8Q79DRAFT_396495 [Trametes meyenii]|nr:hypothetical protein C8Q79DRAFT_396495 [Trametes meyenii]